jgi:hypothetical protein
MLLEIILFYPDVGIRQVVRFFGYRRLRDILGQSLTPLQALQTNGRRLFRSQELTRTHRQRLMRNSFLPGRSHVRK